MHAEGCGSTTFRREELGRGFEPNACFYVANLARVKGKPTWPAHGSPSRLSHRHRYYQPFTRLVSIFAAFGVPEVCAQLVHSCTSSILTGSSMSRVLISHQQFPLMTCEPYTTIVADSSVRVSTSHGRLWQGLF